MCLRHPCVAMTENTITIALPACCLAHLLFKNKSNIPDSRQPGVERLQAGLLEVNLHLDLNPQPPRDADGPYTELNDGLKIYQVLLEFSLLQTLSHHVY